MKREFKIISLEYLEMMSDDKSFINTMLETFLNQAVEIKKSILEALAKDDGEELASALHKAKSSLSIVGMEEDAAKMSVAEEDLQSGKCSPESCRESIESFIARIDAAAGEVKLAKTELL